MHDVALCCVLLACRSSPLNLLQESYPDPWQHIICCVLCSRTSGSQLIRTAIASFFQALPTPTAVLEADGELHVPPAHSLVWNVEAVYHLSVALWQSSWHVLQHLFRFQGFCVLACTPSCTLSKPCSILPYSVPCRLNGVLICRRRGFEGPAASTGPSGLAHGCRKVSVTWFPGNRLANTSGVSVSHCVHIAHAAAVVDQWQQDLACAKAGGMMAVHSKLTCGRWLCPVRASSIDGRGCMQIGHARGRPAGILGHQTPHPACVSVLFSGCGKFVEDSWRIFCRGDRDGRGECDLCNSV
jgi:hypothetical protein